MSLYPIFYINMIPKKLKLGDTIMIISPSKSLSIAKNQTIKNAEETLKKLWFKVVFSKKCKEVDLFNSSSIKSRIEDLHEAFINPKINWILVFSWGFNINQLLSYIDYNIIKNNPKIICWYSDTTVLLNTITTKTSLITYLWPNFYSLSFKEWIEYTLNYFKKCLMYKNSFSIKHSENYYDDSLKKKLILQKNTNFWNINNGKVTWKLIWWNLCSFNLLHGTIFMPDISETIICIEDDNIMWEYFCEEFDRNLQSLIHQKNFSKIKWIIFWRFQNSSHINLKKLNYIISTKKELDNLPIIANVDFWHTLPMITLTIWGIVKLDINNTKSSIEILKH